MAHAVAQIRPHIIMDAHNWDGGDHFDANCVEVTRDGLAPLARAAAALQATGVAQLTSAGYAVAATSYGPTADPHLAHRWLTSWGSCPAWSRPTAAIPATPRTSSAVRDSCRADPRAHVPLRERTSGPGRPGGRWHTVCAGSASVPLHPTCFPSGSPGIGGFGGQTSRPMALESVRLWPCPLRRRPVPAGRGDQPWCRKREGTDTIVAPASGRPSAGRPGRRRYQRSRYSLAPRPAPAACDRRR